MICFHILFTKYYGLCFYFELFSKQIYESKFLQIFASQFVCALSRFLHNWICHLILKCSTYQMVLVFQETADPCDDGWWNHRRIWPPPTSRNRNRVDVTLHTHHARSIHIYTHHTTSRCGKRRMIAYMIHPPSRNQIFLKRLPIFVRFHIKIKSHRKDPTMK